jgi:hypothetical protein
VTAEELERQAEENLADCRVSLDSIARWFHANASDLRDYTPMADAVPTRIEAGIVRDFPAARYLFERASRARPATPEEEAYYEDRRRSGAWPDLYATPDLPARVRRQAAEKSGSNVDLVTATGGEPYLPVPAAGDRKSGVSSAHVAKTNHAPGGTAVADRDEEPEPPLRGDDQGREFSADPDDPATVAAVSNGHHSALAGDRSPESGSLSPGDGRTPASATAGRAPDLPGPEVGTRATLATLRENRAGEPDDAPALDEHSEEALGRFLDAHDEQDAEEQQGGGDPE